MDDQAVQLVAEVSLSSPFTCLNCGCVTARSNAGRWYHVYGELDVGPSAEAVAERWAACRPLHVELFEARRRRWWQFWRRSVQY